MSIPLDRLYNFIENTAFKIYEDPVIIYRFWPQGSKNIHDLTPMPTYYRDWFSSMTLPRILCHDQEPLMHEFYRWHLHSSQGSAFVDLLKSLNVFLPSQNLKYSNNIFQKNILLHSEKRSKNVEKYLADAELIPVYYWSHAVIAGDWFRYAEHENFKKNKKMQKRFLIYNRAWSGTREYRLKFADMLIRHDLDDQCLTFFNAADDGKHYQEHTFQNTVWRPRHELEHYFQPSPAGPCASADFDTQHYQSTEIEVVLETLFDDDRLHLTEKSLRPIACRQPFILAATYGSLQYLRDYGFKTFSDVWDESYDEIEDPYDRMQAIIQLMIEITARSDDQRCNDHRQLQQIADHNQKHFFSKDFSDMVTGELHTNMTEAFDQIKQDPGFDKWLDKWEHHLQFSQINNFLDVSQDMYGPTRQQYEEVLEWIRQNFKTVADRIEI